MALTRVINEGIGSASAIAGEGTATTNLQQGLAKAWINFNGTGTIATQDSLNVSGITDNGTGDYTSTFSSNMNNDDWSGWASSEGGENAVSAVTTSTFRTLVKNSGGTLSDVSIVMQGLMGDLA